MTDDRTGLTKNAKGGKGAKKISNLAKRLKEKRSERGVYKSIILFFVTPEERGVCDHKQKQRCKTLRK